MASGMQSGKIWSQLTPRVSGNVILLKSGNSVIPGQVSAVGVPSVRNTIASCSMSVSPYER